MNAIAVKVPGDKYRFDRPKPSRAAALQDKRVIDALTAAGFVNTAAAIGWNPISKPLMAVVGRKDRNQVAMSKADLKKGTTVCEHCSHPRENHEGADHEGQCLICRALAKQNNGDGVRCMSFVSA